MNPLTVSKARPLVLLEVLIGLSLTAILLTFLFSFFAESAKMEKRLETARSEITSRQFLQTRLQAVLTGIERGSSRAPLYTKLFRGEEKKSLVILYDNGIDPDPSFSGPILGRLLIDEDHNLSLVTWPLEKEKKHSWRKETLLSNVSNFEFEFLAPKSEETSQKTEKARSINSSWEWRREWADNRSDTPSIIRLSVWQKEKSPIQFAFLLPSPEPLVTYWEGGQRS